MLKDHKYIYFLKSHCGGGGVHFSHFTVTGIRDSFRWSFIALHTTCGLWTTAKKNVLAATTEFSSNRRRRLWNDRGYPSVYRVQYVDRIHDTTVGVTTIRCIIYSRTGNRDIIFTLSSDIKGKRCPQWLLSPVGWLYFRRLISVRSYTKSE